MAVTKFATKITVNLGLMKVSQAVKIPYKPPILRDRGGDINKRWYIEAYIFDSASNDLVRRQIMIPSKYKTASERLSHAAIIINSLNELLHEGYHIGESSEPEPEDHNKSLQFCLDNFVNIKTQSLRASSIKDYKTLKNRMLDHFGDVNIMIIDKSQVLEFLEKQQSTYSVSNRTRNNYYLNLRTFFNFWKERGLITDNPTKGIRLLPVTKKQYTPFKDADIKRIWRHLKSFDPQLFLFTKLMYFTFARRNELRLLKVGAINLKGRTITIRPEDAKNKRVRHLTINDSLAAYLEEINPAQYPPDYYLFGNTHAPGKRPYSYNRLSGKHAEALEALKIKNGESLYSWKHTGVRMAVMKFKMNIVTIQQQCGHANIQQTMDYLRDLGVYIAEDMNKMTDDI